MSKHKADLEELVSGIGRDWVIEGRYQGLTQQGPLVETKIDQTAVLLMVYHNLLKA